VGVFTSRRIGSGKLDDIGEVTSVAASTYLGLIGLVAISCRTTGGATNEVISLGESRPGDKVVVSGTTE